MGRWPGGTPVSDALLVYGLVMLVLLTLVLCIQAAEPLD